MNKLLVRAGAAWLLAAGVASSAFGQNIVIDDFSTNQSVQVNGDDKQTQAEDFVQGLGLLGGERDVSLDGNVDAADFTLWQSQSGRGQFSASGDLSGPAFNGFEPPAGFLFLIYRTVADGSVDFISPDDDTPRADFSASDRIRVAVADVTGSVSFSIGITTNTVGGGNGALISPNFAITDAGILDIPFTDFDLFFGTTDLSDVVDVFVQIEVDAGESITLNSITAVPTPGVATLAAIAGFATTRRRR